jgi:hypothetical protein
MLHLAYSSQRQIGGGGVEISLRSIKEKEFISIHPSKYIVAAIEKEIYISHSSTCPTHGRLCTAEYMRIRRKRGPCWRPMMMGIPGR